MSVAHACPNCGRDLTPHVGPPDHAPWVCLLPAGCGRGWWVRELEPDAQRMWDAATGSHLHRDGRVHAEFRLQVHAELEEALARRTSVRADMLPRLATADLKRLAAASGRLEPTFGSVVRAAAKGRG